MDEGNGVGEKILAEAKKFYFSQHQYGYVLRESHKRWERELFLTGKQSDWIANGLKARSKSFGDNKRREAIDLDGAEMVLIEGSNQKGIYLSIQVKESGKENRFVVVPAGNKGRHWYRISVMIGSVQQSVKVARNQVTEKSRSYADSLRGNTLGGEGDAAIKSLQCKLEDLEKEVKLLRSQMTAADTFNHREDRSRPGIAEEAGGQDAAAVENPSFPVRKKKLHPTDTRGSDPMVRIDSNDARDSFLALCTRFFNDLSEYIHFKNENGGAEYFQNKKDIEDVSIEKSTSNTDSENGLEHLSSSTETSKEVNSSILSYTTGLEEALEPKELNYIPLGEEEFIEEVDSFPGAFHNKEEFSNGEAIIENTPGVDADNPSGNDLVWKVHGDKSPIAQSIENDEDDDSEDNLEDDNNEIFWDDIYECYAHSSGMRYEPQTNTYFAEVSGEPNDLSCFYFVPKQGKLKLAYKGKLGGINKEILNEKGWDLTTIAKSLCFPSNLLDLFRIKLADDELSGM